MDKIANEFIKQGGNSLHEDICRLLSKCVMTSTWPKAWKEEKITLLHKGKSKNDLNNYHVISVGSNLAKLGPD